jgi:hypothetical protein
MTTADLAHDYLADVSDLKVDRYNGRITESEYQHAREDLLTSYVAAHYPAVSDARPDEDDVRLGVLGQIETAHAEFYRNH